MSCDVNRDATSLPAIASGLSRSVRSVGTAASSVRVYACSGGGFLTSDNGGDTNHAPQIQPLYPLSN